MAAVVLVGGLGACGVGQPEADEALKAAEGAITAQHADAMRFAPQAFTAVMASYDSARSAYDAQDWRVVVALAERTAARARELAPAITAGKERSAAAWPAVRDSVRGMLTALADRLAEIERTRRYPEGLTVTATRAARAEVDTLASGLDKAQGAFDRGELADAMHATERVRRQAGALMQSIGLAPRNPHGS